MKTKKLFVSLGIIVICLIGYIIWNKSYNTDSEIQRIVQKEIVSEGINIKKSVSGINSGGSTDTWSIGINNSGQEVNIFSRIKNNELLNLVLEDSQSYDKKGVQNLLELKGGYKVIKGEGYDRTTNVVKGP